MKKVKQIISIIMLLCFLCGAVVCAETDTTQNVEAATKSSSLQRTTYTTFESGQWVDATQMARLSDSWNGYFYVAGAISWGFCAQNSVPGWYNNQVKGGYIVEWNDATVRKILYYAPGSPGYTGTNQAYDMDNATYATGYMNGDSNNNTRAQTYIASLANLTDPIVYGYRAYYMYNSETAYQDIAFLGLGPQGALEIVKYSSNSSLTNNNGNYSLAGAVYGVYAEDGDYSAPEYTITLSEWSDGWSGLPQGVKYGWGKIEGLTPGNYWIKEITAPSGFELDPNWYPSYSTPVTVTSGNTARINVYDNPQLGTLEIYKSSANPEITNNNDGYSLKDAVYGVYLADGDYSSPEYRITTDENGYGVIRNIPIGNYWVKEITAPKGFLLDENWYPSYHQSVYVGNAAVATVKVKDEPILIQIDIIKMQEGTEFVIPGAVFEHRKPDGTTEVLSTDENGRLSFEKVEYGVHEIREVSVMDGYLLNENVISFSVEAGGKVTLTSEIDDSKGNVELRVTDNGNVELTVCDKVIPYSFVIHKKNNADIVLEGAKFILCSDAECTDILQEGVTNENGELKFAGLVMGNKYYLKETEAPMGYRLPADADGNPVVTEIEVLSVPVQDEFRIQINGIEEVLTVTGTGAEPEVNLTVTNETGYRLPQTGSGEMMGLSLAAILLMYAGIHTKNVRRRMKNEKE